MANGAVVTGIGCVTGFGCGTAAFWSGLVSGSSAIRTEERDLGAGAHEMPSAAAPDAAALAAVAKSLGIGPASRIAHLALIAAAEAWRSAEFPPETDRDRIGVMIARTFTQHEIVGQFKRTLWERGPSAVSGLQFVQTISNSVLGRVALEHKARGPSLLQFGGTALGPALDALRAGKADAILAGACDEVSDFVRYLCERHALTSPTAVARGGAAPYDLERDGLVPADGAVFFVLEADEAARRRGARVLARLAGYATVTDRAAVRTPTERDARDVEAAIRRALHDGDCTPREAGFVSGSGCGLPGTASIDGGEMAAVGSVFGSSVPLFSHKGALGEGWSAGGALAAAAAVLALAERTVPACAGTRRTNGVAGPVVGAARANDAQAAVALALDTIGQNCAYVFTRPA